MKILLIGGCGYVGTFLYHELIKRDFDVTVCDTLRSGNPSDISIAYSSYEALTKRELKPYDIVLWFAGHSSVKSAIEDPTGAVVNNCTNLFALAQRLPVGARLIYASTASLYSKKNVDVASKEDSLISIPNQNAYDMSKFSFDYLAENFLPNTVGIRMGTVSGFSANLRTELIFNAMNISARSMGYVSVQNGSASRTILFLSDLWKLIEKLISEKRVEKIYNAGSYTSSIAGLAQRIATVWNAEIVSLGNTETYSFEMNCTRMRKLCGPYTSEDKFTAECEKFIAEYEDKNA